MNPSLSLHSVIKNNYASNSSRLFTAKVDQIIFSCMDQDDFRIKCLCEKLCMSRMQLHRKLKALTGLSTSAYIRKLKLKRALSLLETTNLTISQIAYELGFKDPSYFTRIFVKQFNISPSQLRKHWRISQKTTEILQ